MLISRLKVVGEIESTIYARPQLRNGDDGDDDREDKMPTKYGGNGDISGSHG